MKGEARPAESGQWEFCLLAETIGKGVLKSRKKNVMKSLNLFFLLLA